MTFLGRPLSSQTIIKFCLNSRSSLVLISWCGKESMLERSLPACLPAKHTMLNNWTMTDQVGTSNIICCSQLTMQEGLVKPEKHLIADGLTLTSVNDIIGQKHLKSFCYKFAGIQTCWAIKLYIYIYDIGAEKIFSWPRNPSLQKSDLHIC